MAAMAYISLLFFWGIVLGYMAAKYIMGKYFYQIKGKYIRIKFREYEMHIHHWIAGLAGLFVYFLISEIYNFGSDIFKWHLFIIGALGGITFEDIWHDKKWHRIFYRNK